jgi:hypothetical protein
MQVDRRYKTANGIEGLVEGNWYLMGQFPAMEQENHTSLEIRHINEK